MSYQGNFYPRRKRQFLHRRLKISNMSCSCRPKSTKSSRHSSSATAPPSLSGANNSQGYAAPHGLVARYTQPVPHGELPSSRSLALFVAQERRQCKDHQPLIQISVRLLTLFGTENYARPRSRHDPRRLHLGAHRVSHSTTHNYLEAHLCSVDIASH
jgi:hypothetical protein